MNAEEKIMIESNIIVRTESDVRVEVAISFSLLVPWRSWRTRRAGIEKKPWRQELILI